MFRDGLLTLISMDSYILSKDTFSKPFKTLKSSKDLRELQISIWSLIADSGGLANRAPVRGETPKWADAMVLRFFVVRPT